MGDRASVRIAVVGAAGRMGQEIVRAAEKRESIQIVAALDRPDAPALGKDAGTIAGGKPLELNIQSDLKSGIDCADVVVDLSAADAASTVIQAAREKKVPLLCGTTGLSESTLRAMGEAAQDIAVLHTPNLSLGIAVLRKLVAEAVRSIGPGWDIEIVEMHHRNKVDAPSGTAMALAQTVAEARGIDPATESRFGREGNVGARTATEIGMHAMRGGGVFGWHKVVLAGDHETIEISHRASSRALFAEGALHAASFLRGKPPGQYTMTDLLRTTANAGV